jgi:hypothetical protein
MKVGDMVKLYDSPRKNGRYAGKLGLIVGFTSYRAPVINVGGVVRDFHFTQIEKVYRAPSERPASSAQRPVAGSPGLDNLTLLSTHCHRL